MGGISNAGAITTPLAGIQIGGNATVFGSSNHATITVSTFAGGIANSGTIAAAGNGIWVGGDVTVTGRGNVASVTISTFSGGISNGGIISAGGAGIEVGGDVSNSHGGNTASVTISTFSNGITNSGTISANTGILVNAHVLTFSGAIANSGTIVGTGGTAIDISGANNAITINQSGGSISGAIECPPTPMCSPSAAAQSAATSSGRERATPSISIWGRAPTPTAQPTVYRNR